MSSYLPRNDNLEDQTSRSYPLVLTMTIQ